MIRIKLFSALIISFNFFVIQAQTTITIDTAIHYQKIEGWGEGGDLFGILNYNLTDTSIANPLNRQMLDFLIDDYGLTGSRIWEVGPRIDGTGMDNGNCDSIDWTKFQVGSMDPRIAAYMVYFKDRILSQGFQPSFYSSPGYPTHASDQRPWVMNHPGERAQQIWANALWWKNTYGININYGVIYNEPSISSIILAEDIKALGTRLLAKGLSTKSQYAEAVTPQINWNYITQVQSDSEFWPFVGRLSYHNYGNYNSPDQFRPQMRDFAKSKGILTAQTEMYDPNLDNLFSDLTLGGVSYWEVAFAGPLVLIPNAGNTSFTPGAKYFRNRQLLHYVRPGAVRVETICSDTNVKVLSFLRSGSLSTIILNNSSTAQTITLSGLLPGTYGRSQSAGNSPTESGIVSVNTSGTLTLNNVAGAGMATTIYPYSGLNHAPEIHVYGSNPGYLVSPASNVLLSSTSSDPENNPLTYLWTIISQPAGANAVLATPYAANSNVSGMMAAGVYIFNIEVKDGINSSNKKVYLIKYGSNPSPVLGASGFRIAAPYGLIFGPPADTTHANIELPTSSATLQVGISDLANSDFTGRGKWILVSQPAGANAILGNTIYIYVSIRADVTGMTVPGDYIFQVNITDPGRPDLIAQIKCTIHAASSGPVINSITALPQNFRLPVSATKLSGITYDPQGQLLRHWWAIKSAPAGARPSFTTQGLAISNVSGLTVPGNYTFTLRAFDDMHMTTKDITVHVDSSNGINGISERNDIICFPNPVSKELTVEIPDGPAKALNLILMNSLGMEITEKQCSGNYPRSIGISFASIPAGIYFLVIGSDDTFLIKKIIKN
jgi:hypothetical protein